MTEKTKRFEEAMQELNTIVQQLETGDVPLEEAMTLYQKGMELSALCHKKLTQAENQLLVLIDEEGTEHSIDPTKGIES